MNVVVCLKQVLESPQPEVDRTTGAVLRVNGKKIINPLDMYALEEGIHIKEQHQCRVTALTMGSQEALEALRDAIALGVDAAVLLSDPAFDGSDTLACSYVLSRAVHKLGQLDLVICGSQTTDGDSGQVPPQLAHWLGLPFVSDVSKIEDIRVGYVRLQRMADGEHQVVEVDLPAVVSVVKEINVPRLPSLRGLMQARKAQIPVWTAIDINAEPVRIGLTGSPSRIAGVALPKRERKSEILQGSVQEQVDQLLEKLRRAKAV
ncbi:MAG: electron transfer flavoprotein subunit beta/FixA family protein [Chloroflexi bacterium]|nr:electron transfer flavoprotein subunit beta/FixA family protein [Chloroflexota bacterium]